MEIKINTAVNFKRRLKKSEEAEYSAVLKEAKEKAGNKGKSILILPTTALPQNSSNNTGIGNLASEEGQAFLDFAKKYWGINEIQLLPIGQFHGSKYRPYSGTSMDFGNHMINIKKHATKEEFDELVKNNTVNNRVNYKNIIDKDSKQEEILKKIYERNLNDKAFKNFKTKNFERLEPKALYSALSDVYGNSNYNKWNLIDQNLYSLDAAQRNARINELSEKYAKEIDFYKFKQFLAESDFKEAKEQLNSKGLKLDGDLICGFSKDEVWAHPKAFVKHGTIGWGLPSLDFETPEAENLLREKVRFYAKHFDGIRIDASWTYVDHPVHKGKEIKYYQDKFLNIIDEEFKNVKGKNFDLHNIMHEFIADVKDFNIYDSWQLKPYVRDRVKIYTSDYIEDIWGSNNGFLQRGWDKTKFVIGATNHDSELIKFNQKHAKILARILNIPEEKLMNKKEFVKAKFAEPFMAFNNMIFFREALGLKEGENKILADFEKDYINKLSKGEVFNAMDALEKIFVAKNLDKTEPELFKKIVKYRKILEKKSTPPAIKLAIGGALAIALVFGATVIFKQRNKNENAGKILNISTNLNSD